MANQANDTSTPLWLRPPAVALFVAVLVVVRFYVADNTGLVRDEAYYAMWSLWPQWGYLDHPPMIAWLIAAGRWVGETTGGVRLLTVASTGLISFAVYRTGLLLFDLRVAALAVIWFNLTIAGGLLFIATPDAPAVTFWALSVWAVAEFAARRNATWWLAAGIFAGLALLSKYTSAFLGVGLVLYLVTSAERRSWLKLWQVWAGGALALLIFAPNLIWNAAHGWASYLHQGRRLADRGLNLGSMLQNFGDFAGGQFLALGGFLLVLVVIGTVALFIRRGGAAREGLALAVFTGLPILICFALYTARYRVEANWPLPAWPMLSLVGAWTAVHVRPQSVVLATPLALLRWAQAPVGLVLLGLLYAQAVWQPLELTARIDRTRDMRGWDELQREVAIIAERNGAKWIASGYWDYGLTGQLAVTGRWAGTGLPVRAVDEPPRWGFLPPMDAALAAEPAVFVVTASADQGVAAQYFAEAELVGEARRMHGEEELERFFVYRVQGPLPGAMAVLMETGP